MMPWQCWRSSVMRSVLFLAIDAAKHAAAARLWAWFCMQIKVRASASSLQLQLSDVRNLDPAPASAMRRLHHIHLFFVLHSAGKRGHCAININLADV